MWAMVTGLWAGCLLRASSAAVMILDHFLVRMLPSGKILHRPARSAWRNFGSPLRIKLGKELGSSPRVLRESFSFHRLRPIAAETCLLIGAAPDFLFLRRNRHLLAFAADTLAADRRDRTRRASPTSKSEALIERIPGRCKTPAQGDGSSLADVIADPGRG